MITKKDWLSAKTQFESMLVNALVNTECYRAALQTIEKKLSEYPDEDTQIKEELKSEFGELLK